MSEVDDVLKILGQNAEKEFVQRIINYQGPKLSPVLDEGNGQYATHRMADAEADGRYFVYPTVVMRKGAKQLEQLSDADAWNYAMQNGEYIELPSKEQAGWLAKRYKSVWDPQWR